MAQTNQMEWFHVDLATAKSIMENYSEQKLEYFRDIFDELTSYIEIIMERGSDAYLIYHDITDIFGLIPLKTKIDGEEDQQLLDYIKHLKGYSRERLLKLQKTMTLLRKDIQTEGDDEDDQMDDLDQLKTKGDEEDDDQMDDLDQLETEGDQENDQMDYLDQLEQIIGNDFEDVMMIVKILIRCLKGIELIHSKRRFLESLTRMKENRSKYCLKYTDFRQQAQQVKSLIQENSEEKLKCFTDIFDELISYLEEIILRHHIQLGPEDSINVINILYQDLENVLKLIQSTEQYNYIACLQHLQGLSEERLSNLQKKLILLRRDPKIQAWVQIVENPKTKKKSAVEDKQDVMMIVGILIHCLKGIKVIHSNRRFRETLNKMNENRRTYCSDGIYVEDINKRTMGKLILKYVGNEGSGSEKTELRRMFQACIDFIQKTDPKIWKDATITIYNDDNDETYTITSGNARNQFMCIMREDGPFVKPRHAKNAPKAAPVHGKIEAQTNSCLVM